MTDNYFITGVKAVYMPPKKYRITWTRQLPDFNIVGHCIFLVGGGNDPVCMYYKGALIKEPKLNHNK